MRGSGDGFCRPPTTPLVALASPAASLSQVLAGCDDAVTLALKRGPTPLPAPLVSDKCSSCFTAKNDDNTAFSEPKRQQQEQQ